MGAERRIGLEQEFFLVEDSGALSERADDFISRCQEVAAGEGANPESFAPECSTNMVEIKTRPAVSLADLSQEYLETLDLALRTGRDLGVRLYPLATYPLHAAPTFREEAHYTVQARTIGWERFADAGRCIGVHMHIELPDGTIDADEVVSSDSSLEAQRELLNMYNLATALDPAIIALTRSTPFYEGIAPGLAARTAFYRGSAVFGWEGVYTELPEVGALATYVNSMQDLVDLQLSGYRAWLTAMKRAGVEASLVSSEDALDACWRPVRVNRVNTVELRGIDGNYPRTILAMADLIQSAANRVRNEKLVVEPDESMRVFKVENGGLLVPGFGCLGTDLFHVATLKGVRSPEILEYLDSVVEFAVPESLASLRTREGTYRTTEATVLRNFSINRTLPEDEGLRLVREACDTLENQVSLLNEREEQRRVAKN